MKVLELIQVLSKFDPELEVFVKACDSEYYDQIADIALRKIFDKFILSIEGD